MTLLNGILALGALAFTVPLAIHLLFRNRFQVMDWGAMHLLEAVVRINRRRLQLMHLLLLILRCLIPILLAFCLARPVLTGFKVLPGDAPRTVVIAIDDSQSMAARDASGMTRMEVAKRSVETLLESLSRRDEVILMPSSRSSLPVVSSGPQEAMEDVRKMRAEAGPVDLGILLAAAIEASSGGVYPQRQIVVVGDFASDSLGDESLATLSNLSETLQQQTLPPAIGFLNLGKDSDQLSNLSVDQIESNAAAVVAGRGGSYSATIRNASDLPLRDIRLTWFLDDVEVGQSLVTVASRSSTVARLTHRIDQVGVHVLTASVEHGDALMEDNRRSLAIDVIDEIKVLLVNGDPSQEPLEGETDYLAIALSPFAFGGEDQPDAVQTSVCLRQQLQKRLEADEPDMVVLANVSKLSESERADLSQFVQRGGTMVVFDGDQVDVEGYNAAWDSADGDWRLPATLGSVIGERDGENRSPQPPGVHHSIYSPWESLRTGNEQPFADVDVFAYRKLSVRRDPTGNLSRSVGETASTGSDQQISGSVEEGDDASGGVPITLWSLGNGDPLAVMARRGAGKVVQFSIPCDTAWSSLPLRLVFLPMMQQLVLDLAGNQQNVNVSIGDGLVVATKSLKPSLADLSYGDSRSGQGSGRANSANSDSGGDVGPNVIDESEAVEYRLQYPDGSQDTVKPTADLFPRLVLPIALSKGAYVFSAETPLVDSLPAQTQTLRLVSVPASESLLRDSDPDRLAAAAALLEATLYEDMRALTNDDQQRRFGREIWRWLLAALLVLLVGELFVQQRAVATFPSKRSSMEAV